MKWVGGAIAIVLLYLVYGVYYSHSTLSIVPPEIAPKSSELFFDYQGVINVHTASSSGSGTVADVVSAAQSANLDFVVISDPPSEDPDETQKSGYRGDVFVFMDSEFSYLNSRLINIGATAPRAALTPGRTQIWISEVLSQSQRDNGLGLFILAHPFKNRYQWAGEYPPGLDGIELINLKSLWQERWREAKGQFLWSLLLFPFNDRIALIRLLREPQNEIRLWDELSAKRPTLGIGGADAEARVRLGPKLEVNYPSYETLFSLVRNHVLTTSELTGDTQRDQDKLYHALRSGNFYVSLDLLGNPKGFSAAIFDDRGEFWPMGADFRWRQKLELRVALGFKPIAPFEIEVVRNGERVLRANSREVVYPIAEPGIYRVRVRVRPKFPFPEGSRWLPWIYTNPFYVRESGQSTSGTRKTKSGSAGN